MRRLFTLGLWPISWAICALFLLLALPIPAGADASAFGSDDFNAFNLDTGLWTFVDPIGDATLQMVGTNTQDAWVEISIPAGTSHDVWTDGNLAPRIMQPVADVDFEIEVKFESGVSEGYQMQGVIVEQDADDFLRFDLHSDGTSTYVFAASFAGGVPSAQVNSVIAGAGVSPLYLCVNREGDEWLLSTSFDGQSWDAIGNFHHALVANSVGAFVGNMGSGGAPSAHSGYIDYFFNTASPVEPEDGAIMEDNTPPLIYNVQTVAGRTELLVDWSTDEPATGTVRYGETLAYELGSVGHSDFLSHHPVLLSDLQPETTYNFQIISQDSNDNAGLSDNHVTTTDPPITWEGPVVDIWYGHDQRFGQVGHPQGYANILGNVSDPDGVASLIYSLNGELEVTLSIGPDTRRLASEGDFNIDLSTTDLEIGTNHVVITATDSFSHQTVEGVTVTYSSDSIWPLPTSVDWSSTTSIQDVAQIVDGLWTLEADSVRSVVPAYDRLIAIGDVSWDDYEVTVPITIHEVDVDAGYPGLGLLMRWQGHTDSPVAGWQPKSGWEPFGAIGWWRWVSLTSATLQIYQTGVSQSFLPELEVPYIFKMRVESTPGQGGLYSLKVWADGEPEPPLWNLSYQEGSSDLAHGSFMLLAHHVVASFGDVTVAPIGDFTLTVYTIGSGTVAVDPVQSDYTPGQVVTLTASAEPGWTFAGWSGNLVSADNPETITMDSDKAVTAAFTQEEYDLMVGTAGNGHVDRDPEQPKYHYGDVVTLTAAADPGWTFGGWSGGLSGAENPAPIPVTGDTVVTATFVGEVYTLATNTVGSGRVDREPDQMTYHYGDIVTLTATAGPGWIFAGWDGHLTGTVNPQAVAITEDTVVTATFTQEEYDLTVGTVGNGHVDRDPEQPKYHYGDVVTLTATADLGWVFDGWSGGLSGAENPAAITITGGTVVTATFVGEVYTLTAGTLGSGRVDREPDQTTYQYGDIVTVTATAAPGWIFAGWDGHLTGTVNPQTVTITEDTVVTATFTQEEYDLTVGTVGNGRVDKDPDRTTYHYGDVVTLTAVGDPEWTFIGWSGDLGSTDNPVTINITGNAVVTATFAGHQIFLPWVAVQAPAGSLEETHIHFQRR